MYSLPLQSLSSLVSVAMLQVPAALDTLSELATAGVSAANATDEAPYLLNIAAVDEVNDVFIESASVCLSSASPAVLAWGIIMQTMRELALANKESRELRQSQRAVDKYGMADIYDPDTGDKATQRRTGSLSRRSSTGSDTSQQSSFLEELLDRVMDTALDQDPISYLARSAVDGSHVLDVIAALAVDFCTPFGGEHGGKVGLVMRKVLLDLIRVTLDWIPYQPELLLAALAVLTGAERYWDLWQPKPQTSESTERVLKDELFLQKMFISAQSRFPHESLPFFKLCNALATYTPSNVHQFTPVSQRLLSVDSFTCALPSDFKDYELIREDEDSNYIQLTEDFSFVSPRTGAAPIKPNRSTKMSRALPLSNWSSCLQVIPKGTIGRVVSESRPFVVLWRLDYPGLEFIGKVLKLASQNDNTFTGTSTLLQSRDMVAEIIGLINTMTMVAMRSDVFSTSGDNNAEAARKLIENLSDGLDRNGDIIGVVFEIFEDELYRRRKISETEGPDDILVQCIQFAYALLPVMPDRVWPFLGRSGLLGIDGGESQLSSVIAATEIVTGQYDFLLGCVHVYERLVEDAITHAVSRKVPTKAVARFGSTDALGTGVSQAAVKKILLAFTRSMLDVFGSTMTWKFVKQEERLELNSCICSVFETILSHCYAVDDSLAILHKLTESLGPAAELLVHTFLSVNVETIASPLLRIFTEGANPPDTIIATPVLAFLTAQVRAALNLSTTLVRINSLLQNRPKNFPLKLLEAAPILAKLYVAHESYKRSVLDLLEAVVQEAAISEEQPPSLLAHLGQATASHFLEVLSVLDRPMTDVALSVSIWRFLSAVVSKRQQWFAIFVLTGTSPRETFKDRKHADRPENPEPILNVALNELTNIERLHPQKVLGMLEFVARAVDNWPWIVNEVEQRSNFLTALQDFVASMSNTSSEQPQTFSQYVKIQICSHIVDILAITTHHTQHTGTPSSTKNILPKLTYLTTNGVCSPGYNSSLHSNLRRNFESKFPVCLIANFKRTTLKRPLLGSSFYYDMEIANQMLSFDPAWTGRRSSGLGFADEFRRANINLSLVEAQINLLYSWKCLAIQLSRSLATDSNFQKVIVGVILDCLRENLNESSTSLAVFENLAQTRGELAFTLLQRLIEAKCEDTQLKSILPAAWDTLRKYDIDVEAALRGEGCDYYRLLLKILLLALEGHTIGIAPDTESSTPATQSNVLEILDLVVARGFRALITLLHEDASLVQPSDFALVTAILRTAFSIPGITRNTAHLLTSFSDASTARCASTLLSWSDQLATNQDPIYGELSVLFLLELSNVPSIAESLALEGVLSHITSTNLMRYLRQEKALGPFDAPVRMYQIWSRGLLPLFLNLLHSVGPPMAAEIAGVLNSFPQQLARASNAFDADAKSSALTLSLTSEAQTLAVITAILDTFREAGASAGIVAADVAQVKWDRAQVKDDIETWLGKRTVLRDSIVPTSASEELLLRMPAQRKEQSESRLEEKIVEALRETLSLLGNGEQ